MGVLMLQEEHQGSSLRSSIRGEKGCFTQKERGTSDFFFRSGTLFECTRGALCITGRRGHLDSAMISLMDEAEGILRRFSLPNTEDMVHFQSHLHMLLINT
ncbi:hypothetical protein DRN98_04890 [Methanosarcinales archaeon]|nr:MAG: hypothetical protein DRN98_04890 [Methanosarcinales archaeon]